MFSSWWFLRLLCRCCWRRRIRTTSAYTRSDVAFCGTISIFSLTFTRSRASQSKWILHICNTHSSVHYQKSDESDEIICVDQACCITSALINDSRAIYVIYCVLLLAELNAVLTFIMLICARFRRLCQTRVFRFVYQTCLSDLWVMSLACWLINSRADGWSFLMNHSLLNNWPMICDWYTPLSCTALLFDQH